MFLFPFKEVIVLNKIILVLSLLFSVSWAQAQSALVLEIDPQASEVAWKGGKKVVISDTHEGSVKVLSGTVELDKDGNIVAGEIVIDMKSIKNTDLENPKFSEKLDNHLKSSDFFDVQKYPEAKFVIKTAQKDAPAKSKRNKKQKEDSGEIKYIVTGEMTIKDKTHKESIELLVAQISPTVYAMKTNFDFDRSKYNVKYNSDKFFKNLGDKVIKDEIEMALSLKTRAKTRAQ